MTARQTQILMKKFKTKPYLEEKEKYQLAKLLTVSKSRITVWFTKMRSKRRRQGLLPEGDGCSAVNIYQYLLYSLCSVYIEGISSTG